MTNRGLSLDSNSVVWLTGCEGLLLWNPWINCVEQSGGWGLVLTHSCPRFWLLQQSQKEIKFHTVYSGVLEQIQYIVRAVRRLSSSFKLSPSLSPCWSSGNHSQRLFQKKINGFDYKINGRALGAALRYSLGRSESVKQASTNTGCFQVSLAAVAACQTDTLALFPSVKRQVFCVGIGWRWTSIRPGQPQLLLLDQ